LVIVEATYIVYWFGGCFLFVGSSVVACCCLVQLCKVGDLCFLYVHVACFCLLQLYRVGVLYSQLDLFFYFLPTEVLETMRNIIVELQVFKVDNEKLKKAQQEQ
jgi:hypothetical protein